MDKKIAQPNNFKEAPEQTQPQQLYCLVCKSMKLQLLTIHSTKEVTQLAFVCDTCGKIADLLIGGKMENLKLEETKPTPANYTR